MQFITKEEAMRMRSGTIEEGVIITNEILSRVYNRAVEDAIRQTPDLMLRLFVSQRAQQETKKVFYDKNPDFKDHRDIVQSVVQKVEAANPGKGYDSILEQSATEIRQKIAQVNALNKLPLDKPSGLNLDGNDIL